MIVFEGALLFSQIRAFSLTRCYRDWPRAEVVVGAVAWSPPEWMCHRRPIRSTNLRQQSELSKRNESGDLTEYRPSQSFSAAEFCRHITSRREPERAIDQWTANYNLRTRATHFPKAIGF